MIEPDPIQFYLTRHGLTEANLGRDRAAWQNEPLLPEGREQARRMAEKARSLGIRKVWTSPLDRARETAEIVASACGVPLEIDAGLREIGSGHWVGEPDGDGGQEEMEAATRRVRSTIERFLAEGDRFLAVTHLGPIRIASIVFGGEEWDRFREIFPDNCALLEFRRNDGGWETIRR